MVQGIFVDFLVMSNSNNEKKLSRKFELLLNIRQLFIYIFIYGIIRGGIGKKVTFNELGEILFYTFLFVGFLLGFAGIPILFKVKKNKLIYKIHFFYLFMVLLIIILIFELFLIKT